MLVINTRLAIPLREFKFTFVRSSGPGGQNVNKVNTKAVLRWNVMTSPALGVGVGERFRQKFHRRITTEGELVLTSQRFRDQGRNVADCLEKLRRMLGEVAQPPKRRKPTKRTRTANERRLKQKQRRSAVKDQRKSVRGDE